MDYTLKLIINGRTGLTRHESFEEVQAVAARNMKPMSILVAERQRYYAQAFIYRTRNLESPIGITTIQFNPEP